MQEWQGRSWKTQNIIICFSSWYLHIFEPHQLLLWHLDIQHLIRHTHTIDKTSLLLNIQYVPSELLSKQPSSLSLIKFNNWPCVCHGPPQWVSCTGEHQLSRSRPWWWPSRCQWPHCDQSPPAASSPAASGSGPSLSGSDPKCNSSSLGLNFFKES